MNGLGRQVLLWMIPINVAVLLWVWLGRVLFGVAGWMVVIILFSALPVMLLAMLVTTVLAYTQPGRPRWLTTAQTRAQVFFWLSLVLVGLCVEDATDEPGSGQSALTVLIGRSDTTLELSNILAIGGSGVAVVAWTALLLSLTVGRRRTAPPGPQPSSAVP